jgi:tRNA A37 methylthiotransferase MiaB
MAMQRKYDSDAYRHTVKKFRKKFPRASVTTDVMVGFPGETDADFAATCEMINICRFERIHVFRYSERPTTAAYDMETLPEDTVTRRKGEILQLCRQVTGKSLSRFVGTVSEVAVERSGCGYGEAYQRVCLGRPPRKEALVPVKLGELTNGIFRGIPRASNAED